MKLRDILLAAGVVSAIVLAGCGGSSEKSDSGAKGGAKGGDSPAAIKHYQDSELPIGNYLPATGGQVDVAIPTGWNPLPRDSKVVVAFSKKPGTDVPLILVKEERTSSGIETVTEDNIVEFAKALSAELKAEKKTLDEPVVPLILGKNAFARYVVGGKLAFKSVDRQILVTQVNGLRYTVELRVAEGAIRQSQTGTGKKNNEFEEDKKAAYAVGASLKYKSAGGAGPGGETKDGQGGTDAAPPADKPAAES